MENDINDYDRVPSGKFIIEKLMASGLSYEEADTIIMSFLREVYGPEHYPEMDTNTMH